MTKDTQYIGRVVINGNSVHVAIPKETREKLNLNKGDFVKVDLRLILTNDGRIVQPSYMFSVV